MSRPCVYIAGPMTGKPYFNVKAFDRAAFLLGDVGCSVYNPADFCRNTYGQDFFDSHAAGDPLAAAAKGFDLRLAMAAHLDWICRTATHLYLLRDWEPSEGAALEAALATMLGLPWTEEAWVESEVVLAPPKEANAVRAEVLREAFGIGKVAAR